MFDEKNQSQQILWHCPFKDCRKYVQNRPLVVERGPGWQLRNMAMFLVRNPGDQYRMGKRCSEGHWWSLSDGPIVVGMDPGDQYSGPMAVVWDYDDQYTWWALKTVGALYSFLNIQIAKLSNIQNLRNWAHYRSGPLKRHSWYPSQQ